MELTHQQLLEKRYKDADWVCEITSPPLLPIEIDLWYSSFNGIADSKTNLPYQMAHIWAHLLEIGPVSNNGMGAVPLSFSEIQSYLVATGIELSYWEICLLRRCSQTWAAAQYEAKKPDAVPPWIISSPGSIADHRKRVAERLKRLGNKAGE